MIEVQERTMFLKNMQAVMGLPTMTVYATREVSTPALRTRVIERLFLKQARNLTRFGTVHVPEVHSDDSYSEEGIATRVENDSMSTAEEGFMRGYLGV